MGASAVVQEDLERIVSSGLPWQALHQRVVLISGAGGFLPAYMVETLLHLGASQGIEVTVVGLVRNAETARARLGHHRNLHLVEGDVAAIRKSELPHADIIIHAASQASPKYYGKDPVGTLAANTLGTATLLGHAADCRSSAFLFLSSGEVYGEVPESKIPTGEQDYGYLDSLSVRACYAESKRMGENMCVSWHHQYGVDTRIVRPFHTYGPGMRMDDGRVYADFVRAVLNGEDLLLNSDGSARRAFCYLSDAVSGFFHVLFRGKPASAYNIGNPAGECSILELAETVAGLSPGKKLQVRANQCAPEAGYIPSPISRNVPRIDAARALGWLPAIGIREGFSRTLRHYALASETGDSA